MKIVTVLPEVGEIYTDNVKEITLELLQKEVGGYIQTCAPVELRVHHIEMLCDEEGLLKGKRPNKNLYPFFFVGNVVFVGVDGEHLVGLTNEQESYIREWLVGLENIER